MEDHTIAARSSDLSLLESLEKPKITNGRQLLTLTRLDDVLLHKKQKVISVRSTEPVSAAFQVLIQNQILSLPVFDQKRKKHNALIDMIDILHLALDTHQQQQGDQDQIHQLRKAITTEFEKSTCGEIADLSKRNLYYEMDLKSPLLAAIQSIVRHRLHRLVVVDSSMDTLDPLFTLLTQSQVVGFVHDHLGLFPGLAGVLVKDAFKLDGKVFCVGEDQLALDAFKMIREKGVSGIGVMSNGNIIDCLSASDLRLIGADLSSFNKLFVPAKYFVSYKNEHITCTRKEGVISVTPDASVKDVIIKVHQEKVHRLFVISPPTPPEGGGDGKKGGALLGIISLVDILEVLLNQK